jgi:hypothetical protein
MMTESKADEALTPLTGGCQCGAARYTARVATFDAYYCHCRMCQRAFGNLFAAFFNLKKQNLTWDAPPSYYASSKIARRGFCAKCGTPLSFEYHDSENVDLGVGSLDHPEKMRPVSHFGIESRLAAFFKEDGLPGKRVDDAEHIVKKWKAAYGDGATPGKESG